ncbi:MAG: hypothetical protein MZV63_14310 [Marinilabiliales bacterium]|nr:hypothetical protein [Marinilabiliales bacterium]
MSPIFEAYRRPRPSSCSRSPAAGPSALVPAAPDRTPPAPLLPRPGLRRRGRPVAHLERHGNGPGGSSTPTAGRTPPTPRTASAGATAPTSASPRRPTAG